MQDWNIKEDYIGHFFSSASKSLHEKVLATFEAPDPIIK